jgi:hypothetical protein
MRKITLWIAGTLTIVTLVILYQLNLAGIGGKGGDDGNHQPPAAAASASPGNGNTDNHTKKPGENK